MAERNPEVDEEKIGTESPLESTIKETKSKSIENEEDNEEENLSATNLLFVVTALMLCVFLVCAHRIYSTIHHSSS